MTWISIPQGGGISAFWLRSEAGCERVDGVRLRVRYDVRRCFQDGTIVRPKDADPWAGSPWFAVLREIKGVLPENADGDPRACQFVDVLYQLETPALSLHEAIDEIDRRWPLAKGWKP